MKVLIIGNGAKELALMKHLMEKGEHDALVVPGNPGGHYFAQSIGTDLSSLEENDILKTASNFKPDQILVVDEEYARSSVVQTLKNQGYKVFSPSLPASDELYKKRKWTKRFDRHNLATPDHIIAENATAALNAVQESEGPWILTRLQDPSAFTVCYLNEEAEETLTDWFSEGDCVVMISEYLDTPRFYLSCIINGNQVIPLQTSTIQRGIYEHEDDPETKGMGAYCPADAIPAEAVENAVEKIIKPFFASMVEDGIPYEGFMAGEFLLTDKNEVACVNLKCGLSDCASVLTFGRLHTDLMKAVNQLEQHQPVSLSWTPKHAASVVLASSDYPKSPSIGVPITVDEDFEGQFFPHRTRMKDGKLETNGGRVLIVTALGNNRQEAVEAALDSASKVHCADLFYRTDIGQDSIE